MRKNIEKIVYFIKEYIREQKRIDWERRYNIYWKVDEKEEKRLKEMFGENPYNKKKNFWDDYV
jgi:hypothetical protein